MGVPATLQRTWTIGVGFEIGLKATATLYDQEIGGWFGVKLDQPPGGITPGISFEFRRAPADPAFKKASGKFLVQGILEVKLFFTKSEYKWNAVEIPLLWENETDSTVELVPLGTRTTRINLVPLAPRLQPPVSVSGPRRGWLRRVFVEMRTAGAGSPQNREGAVVVSDGNRDPDSLSLAVATFDPQGSWGTPSPVPGSSRAAGSAAARLVDGRLVVAWVEVNALGDGSSVQTAVRSPSGVWGPPLEIVGANEVNHSPQMVPANAGVLLAWLRGGQDGPSALRNSLLAVEFDGTNWTTPEVVRATGPLTSFSLASTTGEAALAVSTGEELFAYVHTGGPGWGTALPIATQAGGQVAATYAEDRLLRIAGASGEAMKLWRVDAGAVTEVLELDNVSEPTSIDLASGVSAGGEARLVLSWCGVRGFQQASVAYSVAKASDHAVVVDPTDVLHEDFSVHEAVDVWPATSPGEAWLLVRTLEPDRDAHRIEAILVSLDQGTVANGPDPTPIP